MNFFEVFPQHLHDDIEAFNGRSLRLIALSAIVCDASAFYFEVGAESMWGRLPHGRISIGVSTVRVRPDPHNVPSRSVMRHLRSTWGCEVSVFSAGHAYVLDEKRNVALLDETGEESPYLYILTPPQLGGGDEVPDALVQAVFLMPLRRWRKGQQVTGLLKIQREALGEFLSPSNWDWRDLEAQPWAELLLATGLPQNAQIRPVLALRGLQHLLHVDDLQTYLTSFSTPRGECV